MDSVEFALSGMNRAAMPKIIKILKTFDPKTLPTAISDSSLYAAVEDTTNSGRDVPTATIEIAIINCGMLKKSAMIIADSIRSHAPATTPITPKKIKSMCFAVLLLLYFIELYLSFFAQRIKKYTNNTNKIKKIIPPIKWYLSNRPKKAVINKIKVAPSIIGASLRIIPFFTFIGLITEATPRTNNRFATQDPMMLPKDISELFW